MFQQDSATAHRARKTIKLLQRETPAFISPDLWPPNSPDLSPVNYKICGVRQDRVYQKKVKDVNELRERLVEVCMGSVGIDLKELGGQLPKCLKFCPGIEVYGRFSLKNERL